MALQEIVDHVYSWPWFSERHGYNFNGFLLCAPGGNVCIDPVEPDAPTLDAIARLGVLHIVLTNRNHVRAANAVRARTGARTAIHPADAGYARAQGAVLDDDLHPDGHVGPLTVVGVPGKSPGEVVLHWPERRLLVVGDAVIGHPPGHCGLLAEKVMDDPARLRQSVRQLLAIDFDVLLTADGQPIQMAAKDRLHELVAAFPA